MELQSWLLYHLVAVSDCNQGSCGSPMFDVMQSAATGAGVYGSGPDKAAITQSSGSRARDLGLRAQKKLVSRFAASSAGKSLLIDEATTSLLDNLYKLMERATRHSQQLDKKQPEKVLKNIVKLSIKIGLLHRNQQLGPSDTARIEEVRKALRSSAMAVLSFHELEFSYDRNYLSESLERCRSAVHALVRPHLTDKSIERCDQVFDFVAHPHFLEAVFCQNSELRPYLAALVLDIDKALETGQL